MAGENALLIKREAQGRRMSAQGVIRDQVEKLGDLGESRCFAGHKTDEKHWKRTRKKNY